MPLRTILFGVVFVGFVIAGLQAPAWGVCAYVLNYCIGPERQWWTAPLSQMGVRFSLTLAAATALGFVLHYGALRDKFGRSALLGQEKLLLLFLGMVWLSTAIGDPTVGHYTVIDHPSVKMTKIMIFVFLLTHIVTELKNLDRLVWALILGALALGVEAYGVPYSRFVSGRLERIGGPDFAEANFFAAFMATMLPLIGVQFLRTGWRGKAVCLVAGVLTTNAVVLTRSRGAVVGLLAGCLAAVVFAPARMRSKIIAGLIVALLGGLYLSDPQFLQRASTITRSEKERDVSAQSRIRLTAAGFQIISDHPFGIGAGNYFQVIGRYIPEYEGKDAHNTYMRCATELGVQGAAVFLLLIGNAFAMLFRLGKRAAPLPESTRREVTHLRYAIILCTTVLLFCCATISLTYVEALWWLLALPVCLQRAVENLEQVPSHRRNGPPHDAIAPARPAGAAPGRGESASTEPF